MSTVATPDAEVLKFANDGDPETRDRPQVEAAAPAEGLEPPTS